MRKIDEIVFKGEEFHSRHRNQICNIDICFVAWFRRVLYQWFGRIHVSFFSQYTV